MQIDSSKLSSSIKEETDFGYIVISRLRVYILTTGPISTYNYKYQFFSVISESNSK